MLALSIFTSLQTLLSAERAELVSPVAPVVEAGILETSPRSFQDEVPLGKLSSSTLSFKKGETVVGTATFVEVDPDTTNLYLQTNWPLVQAALFVGSCEDPSDEAFVLEAAADATTPLELPKGLEEIFHPRVPYILVVEDTTTSYCLEL